jgi:hypothetical protein
MGFENIDSSASIYNVNSHLHLNESNTHLLIDHSPFMFDGTTLKSTPALAVKSIEALQDGSKVVIGD